MAKTTHSATTRSVYITSQPPFQGSVTVWALRDFVSALDAEAIPDDAEVTAHRDHNTLHFTHLSVRHTVTVAPAPAPGEVER